MAKKIINIRRGVFETNSSSMHSISICWDGNNTELLHPVDGVLDVQFDEFGWEQEEYNDVHTKLSYLLTYIFSGCDAIECGEDRDEYKQLMRVLSKYCGVECLNYLNCNEVNYWQFGYIDHQSMDVPEECFESDDKLINFLFNPGSILITDNDNH